MENVENKKSNRTNKSLMIVAIIMAVISLIVFVVNMTVFIPMLKLIHDPGTGEEALGGALAAVILLPVSIIIGIIGSGTAIIGIVNASVWVGRTKKPFSIVVLIITIVEVLQLPLLFVLLRIFAN